MLYNLLDYLEASAAAFPDKTAFETPEQSMTFGRLRSTAMAIGSRLAGSIAPRQPVAVYMDKGVAAVAAFMGALYAGGFYCFIDPKQPAPRTAAILKALRPAAVITEAEAPKDCGCPVFVYEEIIRSSINAEVLSAIRSDHIDLDPAYCSFTSGSTGTPKGVLVSHRSVIDFMENFVPLFGITDNDVLACQSPLDFDVSVKDIFSGLKAGASVLLIPKFYFVFLANLMEWLEAKGATTLIWAVSALCILSQRGALEFCRPSKINKILFSGEAMPPAQLLIWKAGYPEALFVNLYGPTEITCNCTYHILPKDYAGGEIPMGRAFPNERVLLLEGDSLVTEPNIVAEVCVAGTAVALGYCGDPLQTAAAFTKNPLCSGWSETVYRTGDMAMYKEDGLLYYRGRRDGQIKRHGRRVELIELENALHSIEGISRCCVIYYGEAGVLAAFYSGTEMTRKAIAGALQRLVPDYMVPDKFIYTPSLPLTSHGKIDRQSLKASYTPEAL